MTYGFPVEEDAAGALTLKLPKGVTYGFYIEWKGFIAAETGDVDVIRDRLSKAIAPLGKIDGTIQVTSLEKGAARFVPRTVRKMATMLEDLFERGRAAEAERGEA